MALLIKADGTEEEIKGTGKGSKFGLEQMYALMDCNMVQMVPIKLDYNGTKYNELWCDEDGKFKAKAERNDKATRLLQGQLLQGDYLVGPVLLVGMRKNKETGSR
jgi:hypothetical protein